MGWVVYIPHTSSLRTSRRFWSTSSRPSRIRARVWSMSLRAVAMSGRVVVRSRRLAS